MSSARHAELCWCDGDISYFNIAFVSLPLRSIGFYWISVKNIPALLGSKYVVDGNTVHINPITYYNKRIFMN